MRWSATRAGTTTAIAVAVVFVVVMTAVFATTDRSDPNAVGRMVGRAAVPVAAIAWLIGYAVLSIRLRKKK